MSGLAAGIGAGLTAGASIYGTAQSAKDNRKDRSLQKELNERNIQAQIDMWNANNAYNTPLEQRRRLEAAGLNPMMMQSGGATQNVSSMANMPDMKAPPPRNTGENIKNLGVGLGNSVETYFNIQAQQKQLDLLDADMVLKAQQTLESKDRMHNNVFNRASTAANIFKTEADTKRSEIGYQNDMTNAHRNALGLDTDQQLQATNIDFFRQKLRHIQLENEKMIMENTNLPEKQRLQLAESMQRIRESQSRMTVQESEKLLKDEAARLRSQGIEVSDNMLNRLIHKAIGPDENLFKTDSINAKNKKR